MSGPGGHRLAPTKRRPLLTVDDVSCAPTASLYFQTEEVGLISKRLREIQNEPLIAATMQRLKNDSLDGRASQFVPLELALARDAVQ
jgi:hypothetical protein